MTAQAVVAPTREWAAPAARAAVWAVVALVVTFSPAHDPRFGLLVFAPAAVLAPAAEFLLARGTISGPGRPATLARLVIGALAAAAAVVLAVTAPLTASFVYVVGAWAVLSGAVELAAALAARRASGAARSSDGLVVGIATVLLGIVLVVIPLDLQQTTLLADGSTGILDASIVAVGVLGAYGAIVAVFLAIAAASTRFGDPRPRAASGGAR